PGQAAADLRAGQQVGLGDDDGDAFLVSLVGTGAQLVQDPLQGVGRVLLRGRRRLVDELELVPGQRAAQLGERERVHDEQQRLAVLQVAQRLDLRGARVVLAGRVEQVEDAPRASRQL